MGYRLGDIAQKIGAELRGDPDCLISAIKPIQEAQAGDLSFLNNPKYQKFLSTTGASAVIVAKQFAADCLAYALVVDDTYVAYAKAAHLFMKSTEVVSGIHASAIVGDNCQIHPSVYIGPHVVVSNNVTIAADSQLHPGVVIGEGCQIGSNTVLFANVTLYPGTWLGNRVIIHSGAVLGSDGFGLAKTAGEWLKIPQHGTTNYYF